MLDYASQTMGCAYTIRVLLQYVQAEDLICMFDEDEIVRDNFHDPDPTHSVTFVPNAVRRCNV